MKRSNTENITLAQTLRRFHTDWQKYHHYVSYTSMAELRSEISNAYLNWIWWILEPFCLMLVYTIVFGIIFKLKEPFFPVFVMTGITMWRFFSMSLQNSAVMIRSYRMIISHIYVPKQMLLLIQLFRFGFKSLFSFLVVIVMMIIYGIKPNPMMLMLLPGVLLLFLITYSVCCFVVHLGVFIDDMHYIVNVGVTMLMYFTGVFWSIQDRLPSPWGTIVCRANPIAFAITIARDGLLYGKNSFHWIYFIWIAVSLLLAAIGTRLIYKNENTYAKVI